MLGNLSLIEILLIGAVGYFAIAKNSPVNSKWGAIIIAAAVLLIFVFGGGQSSPLSGVGVTLGGMNITLLLIIGAVIYFIIKRNQEGGKTNVLWIVLGGILLLSSFQGTSNL